MTTIRASWTEIERWLEANAEELLDELAEPAPPARIASVERRLGVEFPADFRESLAIHDGQRDKGFGFIAAHYCLRPLSRMPAAWDLLRDLVSRQSPPKQGDRIDADRGVQRVWWSERWIPIAEAGIRDQICIDLAPAEGGRAGQLVRYLGDSAERRVVATSFEEWLAAVAAKMAAGRYRVKRDRDGDLDEVVDLDEGPS